MPNGLLDYKPDDAIPLIPLTEKQLSPWLETREESVRTWMTTTGFKAKSHTYCLIPATSGALSAVVAGIEAPDDLWALASLPGALPPGNYYIASDWNPAALERVTIGWGLGAYRFTRYRPIKQPLAKLAIDHRCPVRRIRKYLQALNLVRDLINTPAEDMMPEQLAQEVEILSQEFGAELNQVVGEDLLEQNYPVIFAVGRASVHAPRLLDLRWGDPAHPKLTLVGKGVCFDSGGLDLKTSTGMRLMKKDMGGAAHAIGLAHLIMSMGLPVRLRVLIAAVENAVAGNALRPGDVVRARNGLTIEIHNTDAEGRLILADALTEAVSENPALMLDFATLTGAARVALGTEVPVLFCNHEDLARDLAEAAETVQDPLWRLPLYQPYREMLDSKIAHITNASSGPYAGAITAALFLQEFVPATVPWAHLDLMAWNLKGRPGRPEGGEAMAVRAVFEYLVKRFGIDESW